MREPGGRYASVYALADPSFPDRAHGHRWEDAGKVMALAAFGDPHDTDPAVLDIVMRLIETKEMYPVPKYDFKDTPIYNAGVEADITKAVAAVLNDRIFSIFAEAAQEHLAPGMPLHISGGCGLNCDWNQRWRELGHSSSVFVPPCTDDSGSAIGTVIDTLVELTGDPYINWNVYGGLHFFRDVDPDPAVWRRTPLDNAAVAEALAAGRIFAWVQGRWEIGPRALGNRSLLAEPFHATTKDKLNDIKQREGYRPIAPCCRIEDVGRLFTGGDFEDPYMLYFRSARSRELEAVTHVDGSARVQTVSSEGNPRLHDLLSACAARTGVGVLCNTSLNFKGLGFINRMSHLVEYCEARGVNDFVVGDAWFSRTGER
jgi:hydroxymethyl cephem carbamoyltransferase